MSADAHFESSFAALSAFFVGDSPMEETLERVAELACSAVPGTEYVGMSLLMPHGKAATTVFNDPRVPIVDQAQYDADTGPCLDALRTSVIHRIDSMADDERWAE